MLGHAVRLIRFPLMAIDEFSGNVVESGLLTEKEVISVFQYITANNKQKPSVEFCCTQRMPNEFSPVLRKLPLNLPKRNKIRVLMTKFLTVMYDTFGVLDDIM